MNKTNLPTPEKETRKVGEDVRYCSLSEIKEIREFINWAVTKKYRLSVEDFYKHYKRQDYVLARAAIMYAIRVRWPITLVQLGKIMQRDHTTLVRTQKKAVGYFGDKMLEVSRLLRDWDLRGWDLTK